MTVMVARTRDEHQGERQEALPVVVVAGTGPADTAEQARAHEADAQDGDPHLARREAHGGHAPAAGEAEGLGAGAGVADHECAAHGRRGQPGAQVEAGRGCSR